VSDGGALTDTATTLLTIVPSQSPVIESFELIPSNPLPGETITVICHASDPDGDPLTFDWSATQGVFGEQDDTTTWTAPSTEQVVELTCTVSDPYALEVTDLTQVIVGDLVLHLEFNGNANDTSPFGNDGTMVGGSYETDRLGNAGEALHLVGSDSRVTVPVAPSLNGQDKLTIAFWMTPDMVPAQDEWYVLSHGSWENRWKITFDSNGKLKWTVNTPAGTKDLGSESTLGESLVHVAASYDGARLRIYVNGVEEAQITHSGQLRKTTYDLLIGQKLPGDTGYNFVGMIDEVRIYNRRLSGPEIRDLIDIDVSAGVVEAALPRQFSVTSAWPNPFNDRVTVRLSLPRSSSIRLAVYNLLGQRVMYQALNRVPAGWETVSLDLSGLASGTYILRAEQEAGTSVARRITLVR
jgi:hypothetical protein